MILGKAKAPDCHDLSEDFGNIKWVDLRLPVALNRFVLTVITDNSTLKLWLTNESSAVNLLFKSILCIVHKLIPFYVMTCDQLVTFHIILVSTEVIKML